MQAFRQRRGPSRRIHEPRRSLRSCLCNDFRSRIASRLRRPLLRRLDENNRRTAPKATVRIVWARRRAVRGRIRDWSPGGCAPATGTRVDGGLTGLTRSSNDRHPSSSRRQTPPGAPYFSRSPSSQESPSRRPTRPTICASCPFSEHGLNWVENCPPGRAGLRPLALPPATFAVAIDSGHSVAGDELPLRVRS